jgi:hypothetical protein
MLNRNFCSGAINNIICRSANNKSITGEKTEVVTQSEYSPAL